MPRVRLLLLGTVLTLSAITGACGGEPPEKEMQQAQGAIDTARAAGAAQYATEEFEAAVTALERARQAATASDYRQALNDALDSRERAQNAAKQAADNMATARVEADRAVAAAAGSLAALQTRLAALEAARTSARALTEPRKAIDAGEQHVQEARAAFDRGDYNGAMDTATAASRALAPIGPVLDRIASPPARGSKRAR